MNYKIKQGSKDLEFIRYELSKKFLSVYALLCLTE